MNQFFLSPDEVEKEIEKMRAIDRRGRLMNHLCGWLLILFILSLFSYSILVIARHHKANVTTHKE